jgi:hypothetical protein
MDVDRCVAGSLWLHQSGMYDGMRLIWVPLMLLWPRLIVVVGSTLLLVWVLSILGWVGL